MKNKKGKKVQQQQSLVDLVLYRFLPYWPVFAGLAAIGVVGALLFLFTTPPVYETTATILIKDEKKGVENRQVMESFNILTSKKIVENEIEVIRSRTLVGQTVQALNLSAQTFSEQPMGVRTAYSTAPISIILKSSADIVETDRIDFTYDEASKKVTVDEIPYALDTWVQLPQAELKFVLNPYARTKSEGTFFFALIDHRKVVTSLLRKLSVEASSKLSTIVSVSLRDENPKRGEDIINTLLAKYDNASITEKKEIAGASLDFIDDRIKVVERELDSIERKIELYKSQRGIVDLSTKGKVFLQNVGDNDQKLAELNMQLVALERAEDYVLQKKTTEKINPSTLGSKDERLSQLIQKLFDAEIQYERLRGTTAENNPILVSLRAEIENMRPGVLENIRTQKNTLTATKADLMKTNSQYASVLESIPQQERELLEANRQQAIKNNVFTFLLQKREESILLSSASNADSKLLDRAETSINPVAPKKLFVLMVSIALSGLAGIAFVIFKELVSRKILFRKDIEELTQIPTIAEISNSGSKDYVTPNSLQRAILHEQLRQITASLGFFGSSRKRTIMVTSALSGEGKSFVSLNYALSLSRANKKVLLVDGDLRNPKLSILHNLTDQPGFADVLSNDVPLSDAVRKISSLNVHFMPAGRTKPQSPELLLADNMKPVLQKMVDHFDFIVIDTPPIAPVVDGYVMMSYCDHALYVICQGKTPKDTLKLLDSKITQMGVTNVSIIFNNVKKRGFAGNSIGYGYGYGYNQKYAYDGSKG